MIRRLGLWLVTLLIAIDQLVQVILRGPKFILLNGPRPSADMTISDWVGRCANAGIWLGIFAQEEIDAIFGAGHCQRAIAGDARD